MRKIENVTIIKQAAAQQTSYNFFFFQINDVLVKEEKLNAQNIFSNINNHEQNSTQEGVMVIFSYSLMAISFSTALS